MSGGRAQRQKRIANEVPPTAIPATPSKGREDANPAVRSKVNRSAGGGGASGVTCRVNLSNGVDRGAAEREREGVPCRVNLSNGVDRGAAEREREGVPCRERVNTGPSCWSMRSTCSEQQ